MEQIAKKLGLHTEQYQRRHWKIVPCSAVTGEGLVDAIDWMIEDISSRIFMQT